VELAALSTEHKIGLAVAGAVFIVFSLVSALVIPRWNPEFPGRRRNLFVLACLLLLVGMMSAVFVFGQESEESEAGETPTGETPPPGEQPPPPPAGNAAAGKAVFDSAGCASCHTFAPAGSTGNVGPDLTTALEAKDAAFIRVSIVDPNAEIAKGYQPNIMPANFGTQLSKQQLDNLIAFLQSG
jgi:mono/diheme cytochrome c family protein